MAIKLDSAARFSSTPYSSLAHSSGKEYTLLQLLLFINFRSLDRGFCDCLCAVPIQNMISVTLLIDRWGISSILMVEVVRLLTKKPQILAP